MSNRIASLRKAADLSQRKLAELMNVTSRTVQRWESEETAITDEHKLALATLFGVTVGFLMAWDEPNGENGGSERSAA